MTGTISQKIAHGSVYTLYGVGTDYAAVTRQVINPKTGKAWQRIWYLERFRGELAGMKALRAFNEAVKTGRKS